MRALAWIGFVMVLGCAPEAPRVVVDAPVSSDEAPVGEAPPAHTCEPVECLRERAEADLAAGVLDRASALLGRAYALEPSDHSFERWVAALIASGQRRQAAAALALARSLGRHAALVDQLETQLREYEASVEDVAELIDRAELAWSRGEIEAARRAWSQARIALDEREIQLSLHPDYRWSPESIRWVDGQLELIDHLKVEGRKLAFVRSLELDADDTFRESPSRVIPSDALAQGSKPTPSPADHRLVIGARRVELFDAKGHRRAKVDIKGSDKRTIEICDGYAIRIEDIEVPYEVSAAIVDEARRYLIVAATDGRIIVRDLESKSERILQLEGRTDRVSLSRHDPQNTALALRAEQGELQALTSHAELWRWRLDDGTLLDRRDSRCHEADWSEFSPTGEFAVQPIWRVSLCLWRAQDGALEPVHTKVAPAAITFDPNGQPTVLDKHGRVFVWHHYALRGPIEAGSRRGDQPPAVSIDYDRDERRAPQLSPDGRWLGWPDPRSPTSWLRWDLVDGGPPVLFDSSRQTLSGDRQRHAVDLGDAVEVWRGDELERRFEFGSVLRFTLLGARGRLLVVDDARNSERFFVHDLERGKQWWIERAPRGTLGYQASDDATLLARHEQGGRITVWELDGETPTLRTTIESAEQFALAASAHTLVWFVKQHPGGSLASLDLDARDADIRRLPLAHIPMAFAIAPSGDEVALVVDDDALLHWRPSTGVQTHHAWPHSRYDDIRLRFAADGRHLIASQSGRVDVLSEAFELAATIERLDEHWLVTTPSGAVDGSWGVHRKLLALVEGADGPAYPGSLAWDRFEVPGLLSLLLTSQDVQSQLAQ